LLPIRTGLRAVHEGIENLVITEAIRIGEFAGPALVFGVCVDKTIRETTQDLTALSCQQSVHMFLERGSAGRVGVQATVEVLLEAF